MATDEQGRQDHDKLTLDEQGRQDGDKLTLDEQGQLKQQ